MIKRILLLITVMFATSTLMGAIFWDFDPTESLARDEVVQEVEVPDTALVMSAEIRASVVGRFLLWRQGNAPDALGCMIGEYIGPWQIRVDHVEWSQTVCPGSVGLFVFSRTPPTHPAQVCPVLGRIHEEYPTVHDLSVVYGVHPDGEFKEMGCILRDAHEIPTLQLEKRS
jgi:hypothetical protein